MQQKMSIDVVFKFMKMVVSREASKRKGIPLSGSARKESAGVEVVVALNYFNIKINLVVISDDKETGSVESHDCL